MQLSVNKVIFPHCTDHNTWRGARRRIISCIGIAFLAFAITMSAHICLAQAATSEANSLDIIYDTMIYKGNCTLIRQVDSEGVSHYGLVDCSGYLTSEARTNTGTIMLQWLKDQGCDGLEWVVVTHMHGDHVGGLVYSTSLIKSAYKDSSFDNIETIYVKCFDESHDDSDLNISAPVSDSGFSYGQRCYQSLIYLSVKYNVKIVGMDYDSAYGERALMTSFTDTRQLVDVSKGSKADKLMTFFSDENTTFSLGDATIKLLNWEVLDTDGNALSSSEAQSSKRQFVTQENRESMMVQICYDGRTWLLQGDMDNLPYDGSIYATTSNTSEYASGHDKGTARAGDEDRLRTLSGPVDFTQMGHHGNRGSNTNDFWETLCPSFAMNTATVNVSSSIAKTWISKGYIIEEAHDYRDDESYTVHYSTDRPNALYTWAGSSGTITKRALRTMVTATFDAGEGTASASEVKRYSTEAISSLTTLAADNYSTTLGDDLPTATRAGYTFQGWYDKNGTKASSTTSITADVTYYARWKLTYGGVGVQLQDADSGLTSPSGTATLEGAIFEVVNSTGDTITVNDDGTAVEFEAGKVVTQITTNADGAATTEVDFLPQGTYTLQQTTASEGYGISTNTVTVKIGADDVGQVVYGSTTVTSLKGTLKVSCGDADTACENMVGATIAIYNASPQAIIYSNTTYEPASIVCFITIDNDNTITVESLPYGTYLIREVSPPTDRSLDANWSCTCTVDGS